MEPFSGVDDIDASNSLGGESVQSGTEELRKELARQESTNLRRLRFAIGLVLFLVCGFVCSSIYIFTSGLERDEFNYRFDDYSQKLIEALLQNTERSLSSVNAFSTAITIHVLNTPETSFPLVAVPDFAASASTILAPTHTLWIYFSPFVSKEERTAWEDFSVANSGWLADGFAYQSRTRGRLDPSQRVLEYYQEEGNIKDIHVLQGENDAGKVHRNDEAVDYAAQIPKIHNGRGEVYAYDLPGPFAPLWQSYPVISQTTMVTNVDNAQTRTNAAGVPIVLKKQASFGESGNLSGDDEIPIVKAIWKELNEDIDVENGDPIGRWFYPVLEDLHDNASVAGILVSWFRWGDLFVDVLPTFAVGVIVVLENKCSRESQLFTYQVDGRSVQYLGSGDLHDEEYNDMERSVDLASFVNTNRSKNYRGVDVVDGFCQYEVRVYPSKTMEDDYITRNPVYYTLGSLGIIFCTSLIFVIYDHQVEKRQRIVLRRALQSGAIVSSLFPKSAQDRLLQEEEAKMAKRGNKETLRNFLSNENIVQINQHENPIAELFEETSVLFCDLVGFTSWSSKRTPTEVFGLLETIYGAFDKLARRYNVFKVETIGDCYVAVTGIPERQEDHAVILVKFAHRAMLKVKEVIGSLAETLGDDTAMLDMRVGLHSGETTGGVLRGLKSRYQLFGDTVNTASRMETTSESGRIHVSQATAEALVSKGKGHWLTAREGKVLVKGKGHMQTYFVNVTTETTSSSSHDTDFGAWSDEENSSPETINGPQLPDGSEKSKGHTAVSIGKV